MWHLVVTLGPITGQAVLSWWVCCCSVTIDDENQEVQFGSLFHRNWILVKGLEDRALWWSSGMWRMLSSSLCNRATKKSSPLQWSYEAAHAGRSCGGPSQIDFWTYHSHKHPLFAGNLAFFAPRLVAPFIQLYFYLSKMGGHLICSLLRMVTVVFRTAERQHGDQHSKQNKLLVPNMLLGALRRNHISGLTTKHLGTMSWLIMSWN